LLQRLWSWRVCKLQWLGGRRTRLLFHFLLFPFVSPLLGAGACVHLLINEYSTSVHIALRERVAAERRGAAPQRSVGWRNAYAPSSGGASVCCSHSNAASRSRRGALTRVRALWLLVYWLAHCLKALDLVGVALALCADGNWLADAYRYRRRHLQLEKQRQLMKSKEAHLDGRFRAADGVSPFYHHSSTTQP
jgi:hypothetical protein